MFETTDELLKANPDWARIPLELKDGDKGNQVNDPHRKL